jgi:hypothetical protein
MLHPIELDPYAELPFAGYVCEVTNQPETYWSLMHFLEAEKYRGVDDQYRRYLLSIRNTEDFRLETAGIPVPDAALEQWRAVRERAIHAGLFMQLAQNKDSLAQVLFSDSFECRAEAIRAARDRIVERVASPEPWRRVLFIGSQTDAFNCESMASVFDHIFSKRQPDEIAALIEPGVGLVTAKYAQTHYIPFRASDSATASIVEAIERSSHVFQIGHDDEVGDRIRSAFQCAQEMGKTAHKLEGMH